MTKAATRSRGPSWAWDEVKAVRSQIQGFGVLPKRNKYLQWTDLQRIPVIIPYLGQECEADTAFTLRLLISVLHGNFEVIRLANITKARDAEWYMNGVCLVCATNDDFQDAPTIYHKEMQPLAQFLRDNAAMYDVDRGNPEVLQICARATGQGGSTGVQVSDSSVSYVLKRDVMALLAIPEHLFKILELHSEGHHTDRQLATHLLKFRRSPKAHILSNAHPCFKNAAFIMGCVNEPPSKAPNFKIVIGRVRVLSNTDPLMRQHSMTQSSTGLEHWTAFMQEFPDAENTNAYLISCRNSYNYDQEITVSYGSSYKRVYKTGAVKQPQTARSPHACSAASQDKAMFDIFPDAIAKTARWPDRVPAWFNPSMQPLKRPALQIHNGQIEVVLDQLKLGNRSSKPTHGIKRYMCYCMNVSIQMLFCIYNVSMLFNRRMPSCEKEGMGWVVWMTFDSELTLLNKHSFFVYFYLQKNILHRSMGVQNCSQTIRNCRQTIRTRRQNIGNCILTILLSGKM